MVLTLTIAMGDPVPAGLCAVASTPAWRDSGIWWAFPVTNVAIAPAIVLAIYGRGDWKKTRLISRDDKAVAKIAQEAELEEPMR